MCEYIPAEIGLAFRKWAEAKNKEHEAQIKSLTEKLEDLTREKERYLRILYKLFTNDND